MPKQEYSIHERRADGVDIFHRTFRGAIKATGIKRGRLERALRTGDKIGGSTFKKIRRLARPKKPDEQSVLHIRVNKVLLAGVREQLNANGVGADRLNKILTGVLDAEFKKSLGLE